MRKSPRILAGATVVASLLLAVAAPASAGYTYDESIDGDLPHPNGAALLPFGSPNPNTIRFTVAGDDSDGWVLQVDPGETLRAFTLLTFTPSSPSYTATFHMYDGPSIEDPVLGTPYSSFGHSSLGSDFLDLYSIGPLGPGQYLFNFWHDNTPGPTMSFDIDITGTSPVDPTTWAAIKGLYR